MFEGNVKKQQPRNAGENPRTKLPRQIVISFIPHKQHRYETVGDYYESGQIGLVNIEVSEMRDKRFEFLVAIHELIEMCLCDVAGISNEEIDRFDKSFNGENGDDEPGFHPKAPYKKQHTIATAIEMMLAQEMKVDWIGYEDYLGTLGE